LWQKIVFLAKDKGNSLSSSTTPTLNSASLRLTAYVHFQFQGPECAAQSALCSSEAGKDSQPGWGREGGGTAKPLKSNGTRGKALPGNAVFLEIQIFL
jgi:hypothetical protein